MSSDLCSLSIWDWFDIVSVAMVLLGVFFGFIESRRVFPKNEELSDPDVNALKKKDWESKRKKREHFWEYVLIMGLAIELFLVPKHIKEVAQLKHENLALEGEILDLRMSRADKLKKSGFANAVNGKSGNCSVKILYEKGDSEAKGLGSALAYDLFNAGWKPTMPGVIPDDMVADVFKGWSKKSLDDLLPMERATGVEDSLAILSQKTEAPSPSNFLWVALRQAGFLAFLMHDSTLPPNQIMLVIGRKP